MKRGCLAVAFGFRSAGAEPRPDQKIAAFGSSYRGACAIGLSTMPGGDHTLSAVFSAPNEILASTKSAEYCRHVAMPCSESVSSPASADIE